MDNTKFFVISFAAMLSVCLFFFIYIVNHNMQPKVTVRLEQSTYTKTEAEKDYVQKI